MRLDYCILIFIFGLCILYSHNYVLRANNYTISDKYSFRLSIMIDIVILKEIIDKVNL